MKPVIWLGLRTINPEKSGSGLVMMECRTLSVIYGTSCHLAATINSTYYHNNRPAVPSPCRLAAILTGCHLAAVPVVTLSVLLIRHGTEIRGGKGTEPGTSKESQ